MRLDRVSGDSHLWRNESTKAMQVQHQHWLPAISANYLAGPIAPCINKLSCPYRNPVSCLV